jgi:hypothetical protein
MAGQKWISAAKYKLAEIFATIIFSLIYAMYEWKNLCIMDDCNYINTFGGILLSYGILSIISGYAFTTYLLFVYTVARYGKFFRTLIVVGFSASYCAVVVTIFSPFDKSSVGHAVAVVAASSLFASILLGRIRSAGAGNFTVE